MYEAIPASTIAALTRPFYLLSAVYASEIILQPHHCRTCFAFSTKHGLSALQEMHYKTYSNPGCRLSLTPGTHSIYRTLEPHNKRKLQDALQEQSTRTFTKFRFRLLR